MKNQSADQSIRSDQDISQNKRLVKISDREDISSLPKGIWRPLTENYHLQTWKGIPMDKSPIEIALYPMLIYELQPKTIIELGADTGGSAVWLADQLKLFEIEGLLYSVDIDLSLLDEKAKAQPNIKFLEGDCHQIDMVLSTTLLSTLPHPWLIIEDAHVNLVGILNYFHHNGLQNGDYLIIEDTNKALWEAWSDWEDKEFIERMKGKLDLLKKWLMQHKNEYLIDTHYQDLFGYNGSKNWNSMLKRM
ncbi:MAG: cephalosporin hydroxylase [Moorea sp. SIO1F2]|uniref:CmcI family methyltransferase n=1 Tax=unclassified Moorena TaxID=2683338 RepID=UPI0013BA9BF0|nr:MULTISPECIES: CmcI family methyltransferase [unclassified Moorena]NEN99602.1 cephalosporin hydroxylase [Moorena sp. SIO3I7]NEO04136.1 cephalosporin hydroxylase [Moorena sp. SIO3I8]NEO23992.1 cephalosporin hydroxylase [Moorena sp. SIO4A5]NEP26820.1 cephalosporin hydroxylase [Moorena sp. SIO3I6]NEQ61898.1 cephalosporin hydroxylase [Moorena sp. SIO4A1]